MAEQPRAPKAAIRLAPESAVPVWHVLAPKADSIEDVLAPGYLGEKIRDIKPGAIIMIVHEARKFFAELLVMAADKDAEALAFVPLRVLDLAEAEVVSEDWSTATIVDQGERGWGVTIGPRTCRTFKTEADAKTWLEAKQHVARVGKASP